MRYVSFRKSYRFNGFYYAIVKNDPFVSHDKVYMSMRMMDLIQSCKFDRQVITSNPMFRGLDEEAALKLVEVLYG